MNIKKREETKKGGFAFGADLAAQGWPGSASSADAIIFYGFSLRYSSAKKKKKECCGFL